MCYLDRYILMLFFNIYAIYYLIKLITMLQLINMIILLNFCALYSYGNVHTINKYLAPKITVQFIRNHQCF